MSVQHVIRRRGRVMVGLLAALGSGFVLPVPAPSPAGASTPVTTTFTLCGPTFTGTYVVPPGVRLLAVTANGAGGADGEDGVSTTKTAPGRPGGRGARVSGTLAVSPGQVFTVDVGCSVPGGSGLAPGGIGGLGGVGAPTGGGGNGGGASGISAGSNPVIIAAGGGGGGGGVSYLGGTIAGGSGGAGGRPTGSSGSTGGISSGGCTSGGAGGGGASQSSGGGGGSRGLAHWTDCTPPAGAHGTNGASGSFRQGGNGGHGGAQVNWCGGSGAGGGGGGRYGGGGAGGGAEGCSAGGGGGGGSSWASGAVSGVSYGTGPAANTNGSVTITAGVSVPLTGALDIEFTVAGTLPTFPCEEGCNATFIGSGSGGGTARGDEHAATFTMSSVPLSGTVVYDEPSEPACPLFGNAAGTATLDGAASGVVQRTSAPMQRGSVTGLTLELDFNYGRVGPGASITVTGGTATISFTFPDTGPGSFSTSVIGSGVGAFVVDPEDAAARCAAPGSLPFSIIGDAAIASDASNVS